jgi:hypothetical protein
MTVSRDAPARDSASGPSWRAARSAWHTRPTRDLSSSRRTDPRPEMPS